MRCSDFIERYSDYRDGLLSSEERDAFDAHLAACAGCCRYHRVLERGVALWCALPPTHPSFDFLPRLQHRLYHVDDAGKFSPRRSLGSAALVAVASVGLLAVAWLPFATRVPVEIELPPVAVQAPASRGEALPGLFDERPWVSSPRFLVPLQPVLDEPSDLFTAYSITVSSEPNGRMGSRLNEQLDGGR